MDKNSLCIDNFYVRIPYLSYNQYINYTKLNSESSTDFFNEINNSYLENVLSASPSLANEYINNRGNLDKIAFSLEKYIIRGSTRTTPFGLLAGVARGKFDKENQSYTINKFNKYVRVESDWLIELCKKIEGEIGDDLRVCFNNTICIHKERIYNLWLSCFSNIKNHTIDIQHTDATNALITLCKYGEFNSVIELCSYLSKLYPDIDKKIFNVFIASLMINEILISDLRFSTVNADPLESLVAKLKKYGVRKHEHLIRKLKSLEKRLKEYSEFEINQIDFYKYYYKIQSLMKEILQSDHLINIDMYSKSIIKLNYEIKEEINSYVNFIRKFSDTKKYTDFYNQFVDRFGYSRVKLVDLFDPIHGMDYPIFKNQLEGIENFKILKNYLLKNEQSNSIDLANEQFYNNENSYFENAELAFHIVKDQNNQFIYNASHLIGSNQMGRSFGRFSYLFNNHILCDEVNNNVEVAFLSKEKRITNVTLCRAKYNHLLEFGLFNENEKKHLDINDISIIAHEGKLNFINDVNDEIINFKATNMLNEAFYPEIMRFLLQISDANCFDLFTVQKMLSEFFRGRLHHPEVKFKNFTIYSERWLLNKMYFIKDENDYQKFAHEFELFVNDFKIPDTVYCGVSDNQLLLNLRSKSHIQMLFNMLREKEYIYLIKSCFNIDNLPIKNFLNESFIGEFVFQIKDNKTYKKNINMNNYPFYNKKASIEHTLLPFSNCTYVQINTNKRINDYLLINDIRDFTNTLINQKIITHYFFIRYVDDSNVLRLRFFHRFEDGVKLCAKIQSFIEQLYSKSLIAGCAYLPYEREINRYGGEKNIEFFEKYFFYESEMSINFLLLKNKKKITISKEMFYLFSCVELLKAFRNTLDSDELLDNFKLVASNKKELREFKKHNEKYINFIYGYSDNFDNIEEFRLITELNLIMDSIVQEMVCKMNMGDFNNYSANQIILSIFHMKFNRLIGINGDLERKMMSYLRNLEYSCNQRRKYSEKKE